MKILRSIALLLGLCLAWLLGSRSSLAAPLPPVQWQHISSATGELPVPPANDGQTGLRVMDLDKNGQTDYLMTFIDGPAIVWYRHIGSSFTPYVIDPAFLYLTHGERFEDLDGDGDLDLMFGQSYTDNGIYWWENPYPNYSPNTAWVRRTVRDAGGNFYHDNIWGDFDGDGVDEFVAWNQGALQLLFFEKPADPKTSGPWPAVPIFTWSQQGELYDYRGVDAIDVNLDGKIDLVGGGGWFEHTGGTSFTYHLINDGMRGGRHVAAQIIPGGRPEIVATLEKPAHVQYTTSTPLLMFVWSGSSWETRTLLSNLYWTHTLQVGDINRDGFLDVLTGELASLAGPPEPNADARVVVLYGDGAGNFTQQVISDGLETLEGMLGDIDNDGDLDFIGNPYRYRIPRVDMWINQSSVQPPALQIVGHPSDEAVFEPSPASFSVQASGSGTLTYQWRRGGATMGGATSSTYTLSPTSRATDNGAQFDVIVSNGSTSLTSLVATLTVSPPAPITTADLDLWLRADAGVGLNGSAVTQWNDQSGSNHHATQGAASSQPTLISAALHGLPVIRFDGANDFLAFTLPVNGHNGLSLFLVAANNQDQNGGLNLAERAAVFWNETQFWGALYLSPFQSSVVGRFGTIQADNQLLYARPESIGAAFTVTTAIKDGATDSLYVDGQLVLNQGGKFTTIAGCRDQGNLGRGYDDNTYYAGDIAEVLLYSRALSSSEQQTVEEHLMIKYGLATNAPPPEVSISLTESTVEICWPLPCPNCSLEQAVSLIAPIDWVPVNVAATSTSNRTCVTLPTSGGQRFFRLRQ